MWSKIKQWFSKPTKVAEEPAEPEVFVMEPMVVPPRGWRRGMWVMHGNDIGIIVSLDSICEVHYVNDTSGETVRADNVPLGALRRAKFSEIPECRKIGITPEKAEELGYGA